jgi:hypothetical protein
MDAHLLQAVEIAQQPLPFRREAGLAGEVVEMLLHRQRQEDSDQLRRVDAILKRGTSA